MPSLGNALLAFRRALSRRSASPDPTDPGVPSALSGDVAVALTEACLAEGAGRVPGPPRSSEARAWDEESKRAGTNRLGRPLTAVEGADPRGAMAAAEGLALAGVRSTAFLAGRDADSARGGLASAASRGLPLVVHLGAHAAAGPGDADGTAHDPLHGLADFGGLVLVARNVQEAVDLTVVARRAAERALVPAIVALDGVETGRGVQDVLLPTPETLRELCGDPGDRIPSVGPAQEMLFGPERRRVPRWFDLERPALTGARHPGPSAGLALAAKGPYLGSSAAEALAEAFAAGSARTGRELGAVSRHHVDGATTVVIALGSAVEIAERAADRLRARNRLDVGVLGLRTLRPFPTEELTGLLRGRRSVLVVERSVDPLAGDPPLTREIRATALDERTNLATAIAGLAGLSLGAADLEAAIRATAEGSAERFFLGVDFCPETSPNPKRQILFDRLRRAWPDGPPQGLIADAAPTDSGAADDFRIAIHRRQGRGGAGLLPAAAALVRAVSDGRLRGRTDPPDLPWGASAVDRLDRLGTTPGAPGDDLPIDLGVLAIAAASGETLPEDMFARVRESGAVLLPSVSPGEDVGVALSHADRTRIVDRRLVLWTIPLGPHSEIGAPEEERLLGAVLAVIRDRLPEAPTDRDLVAARESLLADLPETERGERVAAFRAGLEETARVESVGRIEMNGDAGRGADRAPAAVRALGRAGDTWDSLPRFWDRHGRGSTADEVPTPDPYLAVGAIPPLTSTFRDFSGCGGALPTLDPTACTGCGSCWSVCPDAAIEATALSPIDLLEAGMAAAQSAGRPADALRRFAGPLAKRVAKTLREADEIRTVGDAYRPAFEAVLEKAAPPDDQRSALVEAFEAVDDAIGSLPAARTAALWTEPERDEAGSGALLLLGVRPEACKSCGLCVAVCADEALSAADATPEALRAASAVGEALQSLPDTKGKIISGATRRPEVGPAAALLLTRHARRTIANGDGGEPGDGGKIALRMVLAAAESRLQPTLVRHLGELESLRERYATTIREALGGALPSDDLEALATGLDAIDRTDARLTDLAARLEDARGAGRFDGARLERLVETARELDDLRRHVAGETTGIPRARLALAVTGEAAIRWAGTFPHNPFVAPAAVDRSGAAASFAAGLHEGPLRDVADRCRFLRAARLELEGAGEVARAARELERLDWRDLDDDERALLPPLFLVVGEDALPGLGGDLATLLATDRPVKVVALSGAADPSPALVALARRSAFVAQSSIGAPDHLVDAASRAVLFEGPALLHVHAPSPSRHGFAPDATRERARLAIESRAFPLFVYDPREEGVFGTRLDLAGNPDPEADAGPVAFADWAAGETRFRARTGAEVAAEANERVAIWRTLQELAGRVTPFTERVRAEAEAALASAHGSDLEAQRREADAKLAGLRNEVQEELAGRLTARLVELARRGAPAAAATAAPTGDAPREESP